MIHIAIGLLILSATCVALVVASLVVPDARAVDGLFVTGTCVSMVTSSALFWYVRRHRL